MSLSLLDAIAGRVRQRPGALGLLALGSAGARTDRRDEHSDLDFFVITTDKPALLADLSWLGDVQWSHRNTRDGYRALVEDVLCEFAIFTPQEIHDVRGTAGRWVWRGPDCPDVLLRTPEPTSAQWLVDEILSDLHVGLHRWLRGERLAAMRVVQVEALAHLLRLQALRADVEDVDPFDPTRRAERWDLPLERLAPGYESTPQAAALMLSLVDPAPSPMRDAVASLLHRAL